MIREIKLTYPTALDGEETLSITSRLSSFYFDQLSGFAMPSVRQDLKEAGNQDGAVLGNSLYGRRVLSIEGSFHASTRTELIDLRNKLAFALSLGEAGSRGSREVLVTLDDDDALITRVLKIDAFLNSDPDMTYEKGTRHFGKFRFELACENPFFKSLDLSDPVENPDGYKIEELPVGSAGYGFAIPFELPFSIGNTTSTPVLIENNGNAAADTVITFSTQVTNPTITNNNTGVSFTVTESIDDGDILIVDGENQTVTLQRVGEPTASSVIGSFSGNFVRLVSGENDIIFSGSGTTGSTVAEIKWYDSFIGI